jgi:hypothetical protein
MTDLGPKSLRNAIQLQREKIEFPFDHPAASGIYDIIDRIGDPSDDEFHRLARRDRYVWTVFRFVSQVMNGGIDQYFWNSSGNLAVECMEALKDIGAHDSLSLIHRACQAAFGGLPSRDQEQRRRQLRAFKAARGCNLNGWFEREKHPSLEVDLYQKLLSYWERADPAAS